MLAFAYETQRDPIRTDLAEAYRRAWDRIASPGTWLTGAQRVAVAGETRRARGCALCRDRKAALSPFSISGEHEHAGVLDAPLVDAVHRITTDAGRLTEVWVQSLHEQGLTPELYVEATGVAVVTISIDRFHHALGLPLEPLPDPRSGEPTQVRPESVSTGEAWVPMQPARVVSAKLGLPGGAPAPFVLRALSLVPAEVHAWQDVSNAQYLDAAGDMLRFDRVRAIDRSQIELVAGRVSALNECFY
jgi:hypothetical protein